MTKLTSWKEPSKSEKPDQQIRKLTIINQFGRMMTG